MEEIKNTKRIRVKTLQALYVFTSLKGTVLAKQNHVCKDKSWNHMRDKRKRSV